MNDVDAARIVSEAWQRVHGRLPTPNERLYTQAIARLETGYGRAGQFGALASRGQFNWGALERRRDASGECPPGTAAGTDEGQVCFFVFPDDVSAAAAFVRTLTQTHWSTIPAMQGSAQDVARAMRAPPAYYGGVPGTEEQKIAAYANAIRSNADAIARTVPPNLGASSSSLTTWIVGLGILGGLGYLYATTYGVPPDVSRALSSVSRAGSRAVRSGRRALGV